MDIRTTGKKLAADLTTTVTILSIGVAGIATLVVWGTTSHGSSSTTASSSTSSSTSDDTSSDGSSSDGSGQVTLVAPSTGTSNQATTSGS